MPETIIEVADRLQLEGNKLVVGNISPSSPQARQLRLYEIGKWFAYNGPGSSEVRSRAPLFLYMVSERNYFNGTIDMGPLGVKTYRTGRQLMLESMAKDPKQYWIPEMLFYSAVPQMLTKDRHLPSVTALLEYLQAADMPVSQIDVIIPALTTFIGTLPGSSASTTERTKASVEANRLLATLMTAAAMRAQGNLPTIPGPGNPGDPLSNEAHIPGKRKTDWKPYIVLGGVVALLAGGYAWHRSSEPRARLDSTTVENFPDEVS